MVYKRYIKRDGKAYGPYYYESHRHAGKTFTTYVKNEDCSMLRGNFRFVFVLIGIALVVTVLLFILKPAFVGKVSLDIETDFKSGEAISGNLKLNLDTGEFIPKYTRVVAQLNEQNKEFLLSNLVDLPVSSGDFYASGVSLAGSGEGYGSAGTKRVYPEIHFKILVSSSGSADTVTGDESSDFERAPKQSSKEQIQTPHINSDSAQEIDKEQKKEDSQDSKEEKQEEEKEKQSAQEQSQNDLQDSKEKLQEQEELVLQQPQDIPQPPQEEKQEAKNPNQGITGNVVSEGSQIISGSVKKGEEYRYDLKEGQSAELISGSVTYNSEVLDDGSINLKVSGNKVKVSTDYSKEKQGFGDEYSREDITITIPVDKFGINASNGKLRISLIYENISIVVVEKEIEVADTSSANETEDFENGIDNDMAIEPNETVINQTIGNVSLSNQSILNETVFNETVVNVTAENASVSNITVQTLRHKIRVGERVRWVKNVSLVTAGNLSLVLPQEAENISVKKISEDGEINADALIIGVTGNVISDSGEKGRGLFARIGSVFNLLIASITGRAIEDVSPGNVTLNSGNAAGAIEVIVTDSAMQYSIEYYTDAPGITEENTTTGKKFVISGPDTLNYTDVIAYTSLDSRVSLSDKSRIRVYWNNYASGETGTGFVKRVGDVEEIELVEETNSGSAGNSGAGNEENIGNVTDAGNTNNSSNETTLTRKGNLTAESETALITSSITGNVVSESGNEIIETNSSAAANEGEVLNGIDNKRGYVKQEMPFEAYDMNNDSYVDYIVWVVPHLSNQTFEIILITKAEHLDSNRSFIEDVYEYVNAQDNNWTAVPEEDYLRVTFEKNLTNTKDITLYARGNKSVSQIDVYENDGNTILASFDNISSEGWYKIYLDGSSGAGLGNKSQDVFDLRVLNGDVEFDYVVDPFTDNSSLIQNVDDCGTLNTTDAVYTLINNVTTDGTCFHIIANNITFNGNGYTINYSSGGTLGYGFNITGYNFTTIKNARIVEGSSTTDSKYGIYVHNNDGRQTVGTNVINNTISIQTSNTPGVFFRANSYGTIANNTFSGNKQLIYLTFSNFPNKCSTYNNITGNVITAVGTYGSSGIHISGGTNYCSPKGNIISNNIITLSSGTQSGRAISLFGWANYTDIINNTITVTGDSLTLGMNLDTLNDNTRIINNTIKMITGSNGIYSTTNSNLTLSGNQVNTTQAPAYLIYGTTSTHYNHSIDSSNLAEGLPVVYNYSINNQIVLQGSNNQYGQIICAWCNNVTYSGINMTGDGITLSHTNNSYIINNTINVTGGYGVYLYPNAYFNTIANNSIVSNTANSHGLYLSSSHRNNLTGNSINTTGSIAYAIYLYVASNNTISGNIVNTTGSNGYGLLLSTAVSNTISNNNVTTSGSGGYGIYLAGGANYNTILNNIFNSTVSASSGGRGILIYGINSNNVFLNDTSQSKDTSIQIGSSGAGPGTNNSFINIISYSTTAGSYYPLYLSAAAYNFTMTDSILSSTGGGNDFNVLGTVPGGEWNFTNVTRADGVTPINVSWTAGANGTLNMHWYLDVNTIINQTGLPLSGVNVSAFDVNNLQRFNEISGSAGNISHNAVLTYIRNNTSGNNYTYFSPFTVNGTRTGYATFTNSTVNVTTNTLVTLGLIDDDSVVSFASPTPVNNSNLNVNNLIVNISVSETNDHYAFADFDRSVVGWWTMDDVNSSGDPTDLSSWSNNGSKKGGAVQNASGRFGKGMSFNGASSGGYITALNGTAFTSPNFTVSVWLKNSQANVATNGYVIYGRNSSSSALYDLRVLSNENVYVNVYNESGTSASLEAGSVANTNWHHVIFRVADDGNNVINRSIYLDGAVVGSSTLTGPLRTGAVTQIYIGATNIPSQWFNGTLDEVMIFNRSLSADEILSLYNASANKYTHNFTGLAQRGHTFTGYAVDDGGNVNGTEQRRVNVDAVYPSLSYSFPTPANTTFVNENYIPVNMSTSDDLGEHYSFVDFDRSVVGWWTMDSINATGGVVDSSTWSNNGTNVSGAYQVDSGKWGKGMSFDGVDDYATFYNNPNFNFTNTTDFSISLWVYNKKTLNNSVSDQYLFTKGSTVFYALFYINSAGSGKWRFQLKDGSNSVISSYVTDVSAGSWTHLLTTFNSSDKNGTLYVNGILRDSNKNTNLNSFINSNSFILSSNNGGSAYFNGTLDDVLIFNRTLSSAEVASLYNSSANKYYTNISVGNDGAHTIKGYDVDLGGNVNSTEQLTFSRDMVKPWVNFTGQTPANGSSQIASQNNFIVNLSSNGTFTGVSDESHYVFTDFDRSLVGWWRFDNVNASGDPTDLSSWSNNGSRQGGAVQTASGKFGEGMSFDGVDDYVNVPDDPFNFSGTNRFSIAAWVKPNGNNAADNILSRGDAFSTAANTIYHLAVYNVDGSRWQVVVSDGTTMITARGNAGSLVANQWQQVSAVWNGTNLSLYKDGVLLTSSSNDAFTGLWNGNDASDIKTSIGQNARANSQFFNGTIDEVIIFNRSLGADEIQSLYNASQYKYAHNFTGLSFSAYTVTGYAVDEGGNTNNTEQRTVTITASTNLDAYDLEDDGEDKSGWFGGESGVVLPVENMTYFFGNYTDSAGNFLDSGTTCNITYYGGSVSSTPVNMSLNSSARLFYDNRTFAYAGNYSWNVTCLNSPYDSANDTGNINIAIPLRNESHKGMQTGTATVNHNESINLTLTIPTSVIDVTNTGYNISRVWVNITLPNSTVNKVYLSGNPAGGVWNKTLANPGVLGNYSFTYYANLTNGMSAVESLSGNLAVKNTSISIIVQSGVNNVNTTDVVPVSGLIRLFNGTTYENLTNNLFSIKLNGVTVSSDTRAYTNFTNGTYTHTNATNLTNGLTLNLSYVGSVNTYNDDYSTTKYTTDAYSYISAGYHAGSQTLFYLDSMTNATGNVTYRYTSVTQFYNASVRVSTTTGVGGSAANTSVLYSLDNSTWVVLNSTTTREANMTGSIPVNGDGDFYVMLRSNTNNFAGDTPIKSYEINYTQYEYSTNGTYVSDAIYLPNVTYTVLKWDQNLSGFGSSGIELRESNNGTTWESWGSSYTNNLDNSIASLTKPYVQFRATLNTTNQSLTPRIYSVNISYFNASTNASGGYAYNITIPTDNLGVQPLQVSVTQSAQGIIGHNSTNVTVWARTSVPYVVVRNYTIYNANYSVSVNFTRTDTSVLVNGTFNLTLLNASGSVVYNKGCAGVNNCSFFRLVPADLSYGNYTIVLNATNESAYYINASTVFADYLEERNTTGTLTVINKTIGDFSVGTNYQFYWNASVTNNGNASMNNINIFDDSAARSSGISSISQYQTCSRLYPRQICNVTMLITVSGAAQVGLNNPHFISWRANWTDNDGSLSGGTGLGFVTYTDMYIMIEGNSTIALTNYSINTTLEHGTSRLLQFNVSSIGSSVVSGVNITVNASNNNESWVNVTPSYISTISAGASRIINVTITIPNQTAPSNYSFVLNVNTSNANSKMLNITVIVPINTTWHFTPSANLSYNTSFGLSTAGTVGNITLHNTGNLNLTFNLTYSAWGTLYTSFGTALFSTDYLVGSVLTNPSNITVMKGTNQTVTIYQKGRNSPLSNVGITLSMLNETGTPSSNTTSLVFDIAEGNPQVTNITFVYDGNAGVVAELNKSVTVKVIASDDIGLNLTDNILNISWGSGNKANFNLTASEIYQNGIYYPGVNYTVDFTPNATGVHNASALIQDVGSKFNLSASFNFSVYGTTSVNLGNNESTVNITNVDKNNKGILYANYTLNNTGLVYCYSPTITFSNPSAVSIGPSSYIASDLAGGGSSTKVFQINVSADTMTGTYNITGTLSCRNPDNTYTTSNNVLSAVVVSNKSFSTASSDSLSLTVNHGSSTSSIIRINNTGNDNITSIQISCLSGTLCSGITVAFNQSLVNITFNSTTFINASFSVAFAKLAGAYTGTIRITDGTQTSDLSASVTVPSSMTWNATSTTIALLKAISTSGEFGTITLNNTGNVNVTLRINSTNTTLFNTNVSSLLLPISNIGSFLINYTTPSAVSNVNASIVITNESAMPPNLNISLFLNATNFNFTIVSPTNNSPLSNVLAGDTLRFITTALYAGEAVTSGVNWSATVGSSNSCTSVNATYDSVNGYWNISCIAPSVADGTTYTLFVTGVHNISGSVTYNSTNSIIYRDVTPPSFNITRNSFNIGGVINLSVNVSDSGSIGIVSAVVTYPNLTMINLTLSLSNGLYNATGGVTSLPGEYSVNYTANDSVGNTNSTVDWFEVYDLYSWKPKWFDYASSPVVSVNISLYRPNTTTLLLNNLTNSSGTFDLLVNKRFYDIYADLGGDRAIVRNVNFTNASFFNFNLYRIVSGELSEDVPLYRAFSGFASNSTNLSGNSVNLIFNYSGYSYDSVSALTVIKCSNWNYTARVCSASWAALSSNVDRDAKTVQGNSTGFSAYFLAEEKCGNGLCETTYSETASTCVADCSSTTVSISVGGGGGGGGGSSSGLSTTDLSKIEEIIKSFINVGGVKVETTSVYKEMFAGESTTFRIKLKNTLSSETTIYLDTVGDIKKFITFESNAIKLNANEERDVLIRITAPKEVVPGNYDGDLILSSGKDAEGKIPVTIRILSPEGKLLDVKIQALTSSVAPGGILRLQTDLVNLGQTTKVDVQFDLQLLDVNTGTMVARSEEAFAVETAISTIKNITIPANVKPGKYMVKGTAYYSNVENGQMQASSITYVVVEYPFFHRKLFGISFWVYSIIIFIASLSIGGVYLLNYLKFRKKRFKTKVEFNKLPQAGENSAFVGKIAETGIRAFVDMNKLQMHTLIAGATGGGKTVAAQDLVEAALLRNKGVIVFDPTAQWTGFLRKCEDNSMLKRYSYFDMKTKEARAFNGSVTTIHDPYEIIDIKKYLNRPGEITIFNVSHLTPVQMDILVASTIEQIFKSEPQESAVLKNLLVYDEVHRLLPKFGGSGRGFVQLERGAREFRKWGIGLVLISQVLSDFIGEIKANIGTEIQMGTRYEGDLERINVKYGEDMLKSVVKEPIGTGMFVNAEYNSGRPYFVSFRPLLHSIKRLSNEELVKYEKYFTEIEDIEYQLSRFKKYGIDTLDLELEIKLAKDKVKSGQFQMADMYLESLRPEVAGHWKSLNKSPEHIVRMKLNREEVDKAIDIAEIERAKFIKNNPANDLSFGEILSELNKKIEEKKKKGKDISKLKVKFSDYERRLKNFKGKLSMKDKEGIMKELDAFRKEVDLL